MENLVPNLSLKPTPCKICGTLAKPYGVVDFNKSCIEVRGKKLPPSGIPVTYFRCSSCQFIYTNDFDTWSHEDFKVRIYNDDYIIVDPDYQGTRAAVDAKRINTLFPNKQNISVLDYGGGDGYLASYLSGIGFQSVETYDSFIPRFSQTLSKKYNLITCFEVLEHLTDPLSVIKDICDRVEDEGVVLFSTLVQSHFSEKDGIKWWYIGPRNGHISIFSFQALTLLWQSRGFTLRSFNDNIHVAWKKMPQFAEHLFKNA